MSDTSSTRPGPAFLVTLGGDVRVWKPNPPSRRPSTASDTHDSTGTHLTYTLYSAFDNGQVAPPVYAAWSHSQDRPLLALTAKDRVTVHDPAGNPYMTIAPSPDSFLRSDELIAAEYLNEGRKIAICGTHRLVQVYDLDRRAFVETWEPPTVLAPTAFALSNDSGTAWLAVGNQGGDIYALYRTQQLVVQLASPFHLRITRIAFSFYSASLMAVGCEDGRVALFDLESASTDPLITFHAHNEEVTGIGFSPLNKITLVSCSTDGTVALYDLVKTRILKTFSFPPHRITCMSYMHDGHTLALGTTHGDLVLVSLAKPTHPVQVTPTADTGHVPCVAFHRPSTVATAADRRAPKPPKSALVAAARAATTTDVEMADEERAAPSPVQGGTLDLAMFSPVTGDAPPPQLAPAAVAVADVPLTPTRTVPPARRGSDIPSLDSDMPRRTSSARATAAREAVARDATRRPSLRSTAPPMTPVPAPGAAEPAAPRRAAWVGDAHEMVVDDVRPRRTRGGSHQSVPPPPPRQSDPRAPSSPRQSASAAAAAAVDSDVWSDRGPATTFTSSPAPPSPTRAAAAAAAAPPSAAGFSQQVLDRTVRDALSDFQQLVRTDIMNMHVELIRLFDEQRADLEAMVAEAAGVRAIAEENRRLRAEIDRLRGFYGSNGSL
ncbi:Protein nedd1 [Allomyces arbusculus]|nr:Protein nedd1 [Allomyces arbusculus]